MSSNARTNLTFSGAQSARKTREATTADAFKCCLTSTETCVTRAAFNAGLSEKSLRKMRAGDMNIALHDIEGWAESEPKLFAAILDRLASLAKKRVVDVNDDMPQPDRVACAVSVAKELGEAITATFAAATSNDPRADDNLIHEGEEGIAKLGAVVEAAKARKARRLESIVSRNAPRGARC